MSGYQFGMSYMSSALARAIDRVLPGGVALTLDPSMRGEGCSFSVTGNAHSGFSAAAANMGATARAMIKTARFMILAAFLRAALGDDTAAPLRSPRKSHRVMSAPWVWI